MLANNPTFRGDSEMSEAISDGRCRAFAFETPAWSASLSESGLRHPHLEPASRPPP